MLSGGDEWRPGANTPARAEIYPCGLCDADHGPCGTAIALRGSMSLHDPSDGAVPARFPAHRRGAFARRRMRLIEFITPPSAVRAGACLILAVSLGCGTGPGAGADPPQQREVWGFTAFWDSASAASVARHGRALDAIVTTWIALDTAGGVPQVLYVDSAPEPRTPARFALVTSYLHPEFRPVSVRRLAADPRSLARAAGAIASTMTAAGHRGVVLDFEAHVASDLPALVAVIGSIADTIHSRALGPVVVAVPATDTTAYPAPAILRAGADLVLPMLYDQHWAGGTPGPIADPRWVGDALRLRVAEVGAARIVAGLPLYGYRWPTAGAGITVSYPEARMWNGAEVELVRDSATGSLRGAIPNGGEVWVTDAELLARLIAVVERQGVRRFALWYVGQEDPSIWQTILRPADSSGVR